MELGVPHTRGDEPKLLAIPGEAKRVPHTRGDEPLMHLEGIIRTQRSPHPWG